AKSIFAHHFHQRSGELLRVHAIERTGPADFLAIDEMASDPRFAIVAATCALRWPSRSAPARAISSSSKSEFAVTSARLAAGALACRTRALTRSFALRRDALPRWGS